MVLGGLLIHVGMVENDSGQGSAYQKCKPSTNFDVDGALGMLEHITKKAVSISAWYATFVQRTEARATVPETS